MSPLDKNKLLNKLIDEIYFIEQHAGLRGIFIQDKILYSGHDKKLANHKTKAFVIIEKLRHL